MADNTEKTHISRVFQDTFNELQAQILRQKANTPLPTKGEAPERTLEETIAELARREGFQVVATLGVGGMGAVVKATDTKLNRTVAIKFLPPDMTSDPSVHQALRSEAEIASRIQHEHVVQIMSWHEVDGVPFFVMEFVEGESLDVVVRRRTRLPPPEALRIASQAARGLEALHEAGIIHRDIKPQNILIARDGRVKIADFGISRTAEGAGDDARHSRVAGTPRYMAPEQARGEVTTKHSDIYSLGATVYYMLTGRSPIESGGDIREQLHKVREGKVVPITQHLPKLNRRVAQTVMKSLQLNPSRRPFNMAAFRQELEEAFLSLREDEGFQLFSFKGLRASLPMVMLGIGLVGGFVAGNQFRTALRTPQATGLSPALLQLGSAEVLELEEAIARPGSDSALPQRLQELQQAMKDEAPEGVAIALAKAVDAQRLARQEELLRAVGELPGPRGDAARALLAQWESLSNQQRLVEVLRWQREWVAALAGEPAPTPQKRSGGAP